MRMFLVGMCDIFLLLYLTALAQIDARQISSLTVQDYVALKESAAAVEQERSKTEKLLSERQLALTNLERQLTGLRDKLGQLERERSQSAHLQQEATRELQTARQLAAQKEQETREAARRESEARQKESAAQEQLALVKTAAEQDRRQAEQALREAEDARKAAEAARREAEKAQAEQARAESMAQGALERESKAATARAQAEAAAEQARLQAEEASQRAASAAEGQKAASEKLAAVTQSAHDAFLGRVRSKIVPVEITVRSSGILGSSSEQIKLSAVAVKLGAEQVAFVPFDQAGLEDINDPASLLEFSATVDNHPVVRVYLAQRSPLIVGLAIERTGPAAAPVVVPGLPGYMPTLIAVRNGARLRLGDRLRSLDQDHFLFQRDRLRNNKDGTFGYDAAGFRGTGDFAEYLVKGDQIVDLEGNFVGVVGKENIIVPIRALEHWRSTSLEINSLRQALAEAKERARM